MSVDEEAARHHEPDAGVVRTRGDREIEVIAAELRAQRRRDGDPTLSALSRRTGISKSALSEAFSGRRLPSVRTIETLADDMGFDPVPLVMRRRVVQESIASRARVGESASGADGPGPADAVVVSAGVLTGRGETAGGDQARYSLRVLAAVGVTGVLIGAVFAASLLQRLPCARFSARGTSVLSKLYSR